ncbi:MAG: hypothetical protein JO021_02350 [Alphaproteobacteria bacterium]|nr:hypothetical protein [Alphaproteobacteria bacterium]
MTVHSPTMASGRRAMRARRRVVVGAAAGALALGGAGALALAINPALLDRIRDRAPLAAAPLARARAEAPHDLEQGIASLVARLEKSPDDVDGWALLASSYLMVGNDPAAAEASLHVAALRAQDPGALAREAETRIADAGGRVQPMARRLLEGTLALDPTNVRARFFLGLAQAQDDRSRQALETWLALEADAPPDAGWLDGLHANIDRLVEAAAIDASTVASLRQAAARAHEAPIAAQPVQGGR